MNYLNLNRHIVLIVSLGIIITSFESSSIGTVLPVIIQKLHGSFQAGKWLVSIYTLIICSLLLLAGNLGDRFGHHNVFLVGLCITLFGAFLCLLATSMTLFVCCRAFESIGIALILANAAALLVNHCSYEKRGRLLGFLSAMAYLGVISGTFFSGILTRAFGWQSVFIVVIFLAGIAIFFTRFLSFNNSSSATGKSTISLKNVSLVFAFATLVCALQLVDNLGWHSSIVKSLLVLGMLILSFTLRTIKFTVSSRFKAQFVLAVLALFLVYVCLYSLSFVLPFYFAQYLQLQPAETGLILTLRPLSTALVLPFFGALADKYGVRFFSLLGLLIIAAALLNFTIVQNQADIKNLVSFLILLGIGIGAFIAPNHTIIMSSAPQSVRGVASATLSLMRNLGMVVGIILIGNLGSGRAIRNINGVSVQITFRQVLYVSISVIAIALCTALLPALKHLKTRNKPVPGFDQDSRLLPNPRNSLKEPVRAQP
jgi:MFS family permease